MVTKTITVLSPIAKPRVEEISTVPRVDDLTDKRLGFLWNSKPNANILLLRIKEQLLQRFHCAETNWQVKPSSTFSAAADTIEELMRTTDLVINAIGDWGSCTTWSVHDSVELEKRGKPTVTICTGRFEFLARTTVKSLGMPYLPLVIIPHSLGGLQPDEVREKADGIIEDIIKCLLK